jgi:hypothetical protein
MMQLKSLLESALSSEIFRDELIEKIHAKVRDQSGTVYDSSEGLIAGTVTDYEVNREFDFDYSSHSGSGLEWTVKFATSGSASIMYKTPDGEYRTGTLEGPCEGSAHIAFPDNTIINDSADEIVDELEIEVELTSVFLDENEPSDEPSPYEDEDDLLRVRLTAFIEAFEQVFRHDWDFSKDILQSDTLKFYIVPGGTFLDPGIDDEFNNWSSRGALLAAYRKLVDVM